MAKIKFNTEYLNKVKDLIKENNGVIQENQSRKHLKVRFNNNLVVISMSPKESYFTLRKIASDIKRAVANN